MENTPLFVDSFGVTRESILAVLVLYGREIEEAEAYQTLIDLLKDSLSSRFILKHILIYDNSEGEHKLKITNNNDQFTYFHDHLNGGTSAAYNHAFKINNVIGSDWIWLLDQDTVLPSNYLFLAGREIDKYQDNNISALVPYVKHFDKLISPSLLNKYGTVLPCLDVNNKKKSDIITAISSGAILNTMALRKVMPIPKKFWLDYVDHWIFLQLNHLNMDIVCIDVIINHHLSIENPRELSPRRLMSILEGEAEFYLTVGGIAEKIYFFRIFNRAIKYFFISPKLAVLIFKWFVSRLNKWKK